MKKYIITASLYFLPFVVFSQWQAASAISELNANKVNYTDTSTMLLAYRTAINGKQATITAGSIANSSLANSAVSNLSGSNSGDNSANSTYASDYRAANFIAGTNYQVPITLGDVTTSGATSTIGASKVTNGMLAGSIDLTTKVTGVLPFANNAGASAATSGTSGTLSVSMTTPIITITPSNACTFNGTGGITGQRATFVITTSGVSSFVLTWGTNFRSSGTLATGTTTAKIFTVSFLCIATNSWVETGRTTAQ